MNFKGLVAALALAGCASDPDIVSDKFVTPDGKPAHIVYCGGLYSSMSECYDDARKICGGNYTLIRESVTPRASKMTATENRSIQIVCG